MNAAPTDSARSGADLCRAAQQVLLAAGVETARQDVTRLFWHALEQAQGQTVPRHHLAAWMAQPVPPAVAAAFDRMIAARVARQPVSQIVGRRDFWKHDFRVTRDTLDPRPETEALVEAALDLPWNSVLDLGTGTGAILISLLAERPWVTGAGTDISDAALDVARENAARIGVQAQFQRADWYQGLVGRFDLIVSNPPYIALSEMAGLQPEVRDWEPVSALTDGGDGLSAYRAIAAGAVAHLNPGGVVLCEIGHLQGPEVTAIFADVGAAVRVIPDLDGRDRVIFADFAAQTR